MTDQTAEQSTEGANTSVESGQAMASPGQTLRQAREKRGLSQEEAARKLNFLPFYIPALENDDYSQLHGSTFVKGYLRAYANFLGLNSQDILTAYSEQYQEPDTHHYKVSSVKPLNAPKRRWGKRLFILFTLLVIAALMALAVNWWQSRTDEPLSLLSSEEVKVETADGTTVIANLGDQDAQGAEQTAPQVARDKTAPLVERPVKGSQNNDAQDKASPNGEAAPQAHNGQANTAAEHSDITEVQAPQIESPVSVVAGSPENTSPSDTAESNSASTPEAASAAAPNALLIRFSDKCWLEVKDANDKILVSKVAEKGSSLQVSGPTPYHIRLGYAPGATLYHQGKKLDISDRIRSNGYATVTVD